MSGIILKCIYMVRKNPTIIYQIHTWIFVFQTERLRINVAGKLKMTLFQVHLHGNNLRYDLPLDGREGSNDVSTVKNASRGNV